MTVEEVLAEKKVSGNVSPQFRILVSLAPRSEGFGVLPDATAGHTRNVLPDLVSLDT